MAIKNAFYAQSGGVTAVINASACGVIQTARKHSDKIGKVFAGRNGILGALNEELIDTSLESDEAIQALIHTPGGAFGSCRYKLKNISENRREYERLIEVFRAHDIGYFFYNGGGDSQDTAYKVSQMGDTMGYPITCIGVPKTVDNDLPFTDCCPGFGSVAKYIATSTLEASLDIKSMCETSTKVFVLEVMGRHAGWIAASGGLAGQGEGEPPHIILFPEIPFNRDAFLERVEFCVKEYGYCVVVASEGAQYEDGRFLADAGAKDAFGHTQLGGVAPALANMVRQALGQNTTGRLRITYNAALATLPLPLTLSRLTLWAKLRWKWRWMASKPLCLLSCANRRSPISGKLARPLLAKWPTRKRKCRFTTLLTMALVLLKIVGTTCSR